MMTKTMTKTTTTMTTWEQRLLNDHDDDTKYWTFVNDAVHGRDCYFASCVLHDYSISSLLFISHFSASCTSDQIITSLSTLLFCYHPQLFTWSDSPSSRPAGFKGCGYSMEYILLCFKSARSSQQTNKTFQFRCCCYCSCPCWCCCCCWLDVFQ